MLQQGSSRECRGTASHKAPRSGVGRRRSRHQCWAGQWILEASPGPDSAPKMSSMCSGCKEGARLASASGE